jgi:hypothetical protein
MEVIAGRIHERRIQLKQVVGAIAPVGD